MVRMGTWKKTVRIKHLFTKDEDHESVRVSMEAIANVLDSRPCFRKFSHLSKFRDLPQQDELDVELLEYSNGLLDQMYDFADDHRIWIE